MDQRASAHAPVGISNFWRVMNPRSSMIQVFLLYESKYSLRVAAIPEPFWLVGMTGSVVVFC